MLDSHTLVAYTGATAPSTVGDASDVYSVSLSTSAADGSYDFVLDHPLDQPSSTGGALNLTFGYTAQDFDGDSASGTFTIIDTGDTLALTAAASGSVFEAGLSSTTDPFGTGNHAGSASFPTEASGTLGLHFGADGPAVASSETATETVLNSVDSFNEFFANGQITGTTATSQVGNVDFSVPLAPNTIVVVGNTGTLESSVITVTDAAGPFALASVDLGATAGGTSNILVTGYDALGDVIASATVAVPAGPEGGPLNFAFGPGSAFDGLDLAKLTFTDLASSGKVLLDNLSVTTPTSPANPGPVYFTDQTTAANNVSVTDTNGHAVSLADLTSHGEALHFTLLNPQTLLAFAGTDATEPVFTVTLSTQAPNGSYDFVLDQPLDQPLAGPDGLNLTFAYTAQDFDGETANGSFTVTDVDDLPVLTAATSGTVFEAGLTAVTDPYGSGSAPADPTSASGTLGIHFGADGPAVPATETVLNSVDSFNEFIANGQLAGTTVTSQVGNVDFSVPLAPETIVVVGNTGTLESSVITVTDAAGPFALASVDLGATAGGTSNILITGYDALGDVIASATVAVPAGPEGGPLNFAFGPGSAFDGLDLAKLTFTDLAPSGKVLLDNLSVTTPASPGNPGPVYFSDQTTAANNVSVTDADGHAVSLADLTSHGEALNFTLLDPTELVAYTGDTPTQASTVFTVTLSASAVNGAYNFVLDQPLDQPLTGADGLNLTFSYTAQDFDGSTAAGAFTVTAADDAPTIGEAASGTVFEAGLTSPPDQYGSGSDAGVATAPVEASGSLGVSFGADGPGTPTQQAMVLTDFGVWADVVQTEVVSSSGRTVHEGDVFVTLQGGHGFASFGGDQGTFFGATATVTDADGPFTLVNLELAAFSDNVGASAPVAITGYDAQGDVVASATVSVPETNFTGPTFTFDAAGTSFAGVELAKVVITDQDTSPDANLLFDGVTVKTGAVQFADLATAVNNVAVTDANGAVDLATLTSHGAAVEFALLGEATLVAYTGSAPTSIHDANVVFSVVLNGTGPNGGYDFVLDQPLDEPTGGGSGLDFTFSYTAQDFDGNTVAGAFTVTAVDDAPTIGEAASGTVFEAGLASPPDQQGVGSDAGDSTASSEASGSLGITFGADGPGGNAHFTDQTIAVNNITVADADGAVDPPTLTSHGAAVEFALLDALYARRLHG